MTGDVLVAGGGVAGAAAALAAARAGCSTVLLEQRSLLGGTGTAGMLSTICGLYAGGPSAPDATLNPGLPREIAHLLLERAPGRAPERRGSAWVLPYCRRDLAQVLEGLCGREQNLAVVLETVVVGVEAAGGTVTGVAADCGGARKTFRPKAVIDCTGNGVLSHLAGAASGLAPSSERQLAGFTARVSGIRAEDGALPLMVPYALARAVQAGRLPRLMRFTTFSPGSAPGEGYLKFSADPGAGEQDIRSAAERAVEDLRQQVPAFREAAITGMSDGVLEREGRRIEGEYVLTEQDVLGCRKFDDGVARNAWPIELWDRERGPGLRHLPDGEWYDIPFRCLMVKGFANLLTAGRCISVTPQALGSTRVMGACMALGEAAGRAAASLAATGSYPAFRKA